MLRSLSAKAKVGFFAALLVAIALVAVVREYTHERTQLREHAAAITHGDPWRGEAMFIQYGCGSCHALKNVRGAVGSVGPAARRNCATRDRRRSPRQHADQHGNLDPPPAAGVAGNGHARPQRRRGGRPRHHRLPLHPREIASAA